MIGHKSGLLFKQLGEGVVVVEFCRQYESLAIIPPEIAVFIGIGWGGSVSLASTVVDVECLRRDGVSHSTSGEGPPRWIDMPPRNE